LTAIPILFVNETVSQFAEILKLQQTIFTEGFFKWIFKEGMAMGSVVVH
jgi:uncharacterized membrane protein (DUF441 family)